MQSVKGKIALITGAAMGMGRLYAERAIAEGAAAVVLWDIDGPALAATRDDLRTPGTQVHAFVVDVSSLSDITTAAARVRAEVGDPDIVINNAGIVRSKPFWEHDHTRDIAQLMDVNILALMHITREFLPAMIARPGPARVLNVASASGMLAVPRMSVYTASKWAVIGWSDSLRLELLRAGHTHVRVTTLIPSYITTGMFAGARAPLLTPLMEPSDVVDRAWKAMKRGKARLMLPWTVWLSGALRGLLPQPLWDVLADRMFRVYSSMDHFTGRGPTSSP